MKKIKSIIILAALMTLSFFSFAQPDPRLNGNGNSVGNTPVGQTGPGAPLDGGVGILVVLGLTYAARNIYRIKKKA
jgi:hypothetical protein